MENGGDLGEGPLDSLAESSPQGENQGEGGRARGTFQEVAQSAGARWQALSGQEGLLWVEGIPQ